MQKEKNLNYLVLVNKCHRYREHDFEYRKLIETIDIEGNPLYLEKYTYEHFLRFKNRLDKVEWKLFDYEGFIFMEQIIMNEENCTLMAIDSSTTSTGFSIFTNKKLIDYGCIELKKIQNTDKRIKKMVERK